MLSFSTETIMKILCRYVLQKDGGYFGGLPNIGNNNRGRLKVCIEFSVLEDKKIISTRWFINWKKLHSIL